MCTAITYNSNNHYFGRTLDLEYSLNEKVVIVPRNYAFDFKYLAKCKSHYSFIGCGIIKEDYPLLYEGTNEYGLSVAGLNFPKSCKYFKPESNKINIASFELIPYILSNFNNVNDAAILLAKLNITDDNFSSKLSASPLHWIIADKNNAIVVEQTINGLNLYKNKLGVLTNEPPFPFHLSNLINYMHLSPNEPENNLCGSIDFIPYSRGLGAFGLPGDLSSGSRFIRAAFTKLNAATYEKEKESISQFFHILSTVKQVCGCVRLKDGMLEKTVYTSCYNTDTGILYYNTYGNNRINSVNMNNENLDAQRLISYDMPITQDINSQN